MNSQEISYIILSFILTASFISIFFFTYVSAVESEIIKTQLNNVLDGFCQQLNVVLSTKQKNEIGNLILNNLKIPDLTENDQTTAEQNKKLLNKSILIFSSLLGAGVFIIAVLWFFKRFSILPILKYSFIILICVAITEFLFVSLVTRNYRLVDQNYISYLILDSLKQYVKS
jgi:hypothetical protein